MAATVTHSADLADALTVNEAAYPRLAGIDGDVRDHPGSRASGSPFSLGLARRTRLVRAVTVAIGSRRRLHPFDSSYLASPWGSAQADRAAAGRRAIALRRRRPPAPAGSTRAPDDHHGVTPPPEIDALESAVLLEQDDEGHPPDVLEQAVRRLDPHRRGTAKMFGGTKLKAHLMTPRGPTATAMLLDGLFGPGAPRGRLSSSAAPTPGSPRPPKDPQGRDDGLTHARPAETVSPRCRRRRSSPRRGGVLVFVLGLAAMTPRLPARPVALMAARARSASSSSSAGDAHPLTRRAPRRATT